MEFKRFNKTILLQINKLYNYDNWHAVCALLMDYALIVLAVILSEYSYYFMPLSLLIIGSRQRALATILHEASHGALTRNKTLGRALGTYFSGYLIFQTWESYKESHVYYHHQKLGTQLDPDFSFYKDSGIYEFHTRKSYFWKFFVSRLLFLNAFSSLKYLLVNRLLIKSNKKELVKIAIIHLLAICILDYSHNLEWYFIYWLLPYLTVFQSITWFIELAEHYPMIKDASSNLYASRNRYSHWLEHFFTGMHNENYHLIHHLFLAIPFWNLKKAHNILLQDEEYAAVNRNFGGIFLSKNSVKSMWRQLWEIKS